MHLKQQLRLNLQCMVIGLGILYSVQSTDPELDVTVMNV